VEAVLKKPEQKICFAEGRTRTEPVETREGFELERVVSCGGGEQWWRTKLNFYGAEPFEVRTLYVVKSILIQLCYRRPLKYL